MVALQLTSILISSGVATLPHFSKGSESDVAFVLSCPGRYEERAGHPAAGNTGKNLQRLLDRLGPRISLPHLVRAHITITNAWSEIEYQEKTGRSEATDAEVNRPDNIRRLADELKHVSTLVVFCGAKAKLACQQLVKHNSLPRTVKIAFAPHPGGLGLNNSIISDIANRPIVEANEQRRRGRLDSVKVIQRENTDLRIEVIVESLLQSLANVGE